MAGYRGKELSYLKIGANNLENTKGDLSISISVDEIDVKDDSSDGYNEAIAGDQTITISGSFNYQLEADGSAAQQAIIEAGTSNGTLATVEYAFEDVAGSKKWTADGFVTDCSPTNGDPQTFSFTIRIANKPVEGVQS